MGETHHNLPCVTSRCSCCTHKREGNGPFCLYQTPNQAKQAAQRGEESRFSLKLESWWCRENNAIMSFDNLTMTLHSGLKPPPPLATAKFIDTTNSKAVGPTQHSANNTHHHHSISSSSASDHHHHQKATMPSPRKSVEFILHAPPSKRSKLDATWTAKQVVDGKSYLSRPLIASHNSREEEDVVSYALVSCARASCCH